MEEYERRQLRYACIRMRCDLEGIEDMASVIMVNDDLLDMDDFELQREADWLDRMLDK